MSLDKNRIGTEPYKGVRDFYPEDQSVQNYIFKIWRETSVKFGFVEYNASILEPTDLYKSKSSEEIVNDQTYTFTDRGDRSVTLRPEMTPTVARMVAAKRREMSFPLRWFSIPNLFRYERPQKGRLREHWQLNCDIFGIDNTGAEVEMILLAYKIMKGFGARDGDFIIRINSREILNEAFKKAGITPLESQGLMKLLDKKNKIDDFEKQAQAILGKPYDLKIEAGEDVKNVIKDLELLGVSNVEFDPELVRGFDYYTGIVFEVFDTHPENRRSLFGGGRYDNLLSIFGGGSGDQPLGAVGFGMGDVTIKEFLSLRNLLPVYSSSTQLYICNAGAPILRLMEIAEEIRSTGVNVAIDLTDRKIGDQIKKAVKENIEFVAVIGEIEIASREASVKHLSSEKEQKVSFEKIGSYIKNF